MPVVEQETQFLCRALVKSRRTVDCFEQQPRQGEVFSQKHDDAQADCLGQAPAQKLHRGAATGIQLANRPDPRHALAAACPNERQSR
jgi:hypothetical protein